MLTLFRWLLRLTIALIVVLVLAVVLAVAVSFVDFDSVSMPLSVFGLLLAPLLRRTPLGPALGA